MRPFVPTGLIAGLCLLAACTPAEPAAPVVEPAPEVAAPAPDIAETLGIPTDAASIADGREIAVHQCANCHGIDREDNLRADAPPLRHVLAIYPAESLAENFRNGIHVGHEDMPDFVFGDLGMDVLLSYLVSIQEPLPAE